MCFENDDLYYLSRIKTMVFPPLILRRRISGIVRQIIIDRLFSKINKIKLNNSYNHPLLIRKYYRKIWNTHGEGENNNVPKGTETSNEKRNENEHKKPNDHIDWISHLKYNKILK